jgi:hypothetical protein
MTTPITRCVQNRNSSIHRLRNIGIAAHIDPAHPVMLEPPSFPEPVVSMALELRSGADQQRLATALARLSDEDPTFRAFTRSWRVNLRSWRVNLRSWRVNLRSPRVNLRSPRVNLRSPRVNLRSPRVKVPVRATDLKCSRASLFARCRFSTELQARSDGSTTY